MKEVLQLAHQYHRRQHPKPALKIQATRECLLLPTQALQRTDPNGREKRKKRTTRLLVNESFAIFRKHSRHATLPLILLPTCHVRVHRVERKRVRSRRFPETIALRPDLPMSLGLLECRMFLLQIDLVSRTVPVATSRRLDLLLRIRCQ